MLVQGPESGREDGDEHKAAAKPVRCSPQAIAEIDDEHKALAKLVAYLEAGGDPNATVRVSSLARYGMDSYFSLLTNFIRKAQLVAAQFLIKQKADVNQQNANGHTALNMLMQQLGPDGKKIKEKVLLSTAEVVQSLLGAKADPAVKCVNDNALESLLKNAGKCSEDFVGEVGKTLIHHGAGVSASGTGFSRYDTISPQLHLYLAQEQEKYHYHRQSLVLQYDPLSRKPKRSLCDRMSGCNIS